MHTRNGQARVNLWLPSDLVEAIQRLAKEHERSVSGEVRRALKQYVVLQADDD